MKNIKGIAVIIVMLFCFGPSAEVLRADAGGAAKEVTHGIIIGGGKHNQCNIIESTTPYIEKKSIQSTGIMVDEKNHERASVAFIDFFYWLLLTLRF